MKEIKQINDISILYFFNSQVLIRTEKNGLITDDGQLILSGKNITTISSILYSFNYIFIQHIRFDEIYIYTLTGEFVKLINSGFHLHIKKIDNKHYIANRNTKSFWEIDDKLNLTNTNKYVQFNTVLNNNIIHNTSTFIKCYKNLDGELKWEVKIENFGRNIAKDPKTGEVLWDKPNEIKEALLADDKNIYVPLTGGQLLALDAKTGEKVWMFDNEKLGKYQILDDKIYKGDGKSIIVYDKNNLKIEKKLYFKDVPILKNYIPAGPFLVYNDIIISTDVLYGKICLLNRQTLEVEEFFSLDKKLVNSKDAIIWNDNKLYVLDIDHTLHIFEKTSNETT